MPYTATGWQNRNPLDAIDGALLCESLSRKARNFANIMPASASAIRETCRRMTTKDCEFWQSLEREFTPAEELQKAGIVYVMLQTIPHKNVHFYDACSVILLAAVRNKASLMVIKIMAQLCPYALTYSDNVTKTTPAHEAIMHQSHLDVIKVLTQSGEDGVEMVDNDGLCLLHYAAMYRGPVELMQYLNDLNPDFMQYRTTNEDVFSTRVEITGVYDENGNKTYIDGGDLFVCPGKSTALNIVLHQNRHRNVNPGNGPVIEFLDRISTTVKLIPDSFHEIPFVKLIQGFYSDQTRTILIALFCGSHAKHGQAAAFCGDRESRSNLLQLAVQQRLSPACLEYLTHFTIDSITNLRDMIFTMYETRVPCMNHKSGIHFLRDPVVFSAAGVVSSVNGFRIRVSAPIFNDDSRCATHYVGEDMPIFIPPESYALCERLAMWFNPVIAPHGESAIVQSLIDHLKKWFAGLKYIAKQRPLQEKCCNIVIAHLTNAIRMMATSDRRIAHQVADQIGEDLLAEEEARKKTQSGQQTRPSRKIRWKQKQEAEAAEAKAAETKAAADDASSRAVLLLQASILARQNDPPSRLVQRDSQPVISNHRQREIDRERDMEQWRDLQRQRDMQCERIAREEQMSLQSRALDDNEDDEPDTGRAVSSRSARRSRQQRQSDATQAASARQLPTVSKTQDTHQPDIDIDFLVSLLLQPDKDLEKNKAGADDGGNQDMDLQRSGWNMTAETAARYAAAVSANQQCMAYAHGSIAIPDDIDGDECLLCLDGPIGIRFLPCRHECYCVACSQDPIFLQRVKAKTASCLLCRATIRETEVI